MEYAIGFALALVIVAAGKFTGFEKDKSFYPMLLIFIAIIYVIFAAMDGSRQVIAAEVVIAVGFFALAVAGFKKNLWIVAAALIAHGVFDYAHHSIIENSAVPDWWPGFCLAIDVTLGLWLAGTLWRPSNKSRKADA